MGITKTSASRNGAIRRTGIFKNIVISLWISLAIALIAVPLYIYSVSINFLGLYGGMPSAEMLENAKNDLASELYTSDGKLLGKYFRENRENTSYDELSPYLVNSIIAVEDVRFRQHAGVDGRGFVRVLIRTILMGQNTGGGSTLSQQTAKEMFKIRTDEKYEGSLLIESALVWVR